MFRRHRRNLAIVKSLILCREAYIVPRRRVFELQSVCDVAGQMRLRYTLRSSRQPLSWTKFPAWVGYESNGYHI